MARYLCSSCHVVVESAAMRFAFCAACGAPVTTEDLLPVQPITAGRGGPKQPARPAAQGKASVLPAALPEASS